MRPPALADWLFARLAPKHIRRDILGDLHEEFHLLVNTNSSPLRTRAWYWYQIVGTLVRYRTARGRKRARRVLFQNIETHPPRQSHRYGIGAGMTIANTGANILYDFRLALRALRRRPGFTMSAIAILGLGIGANTTVFSVVDGVLLKPLPYPDPDRLVGVFRYDSTYMGSNPTYASISDWYSVPFRLYRDWAELNIVFEHVGAYSTRTLTVTGGDRPERLAGAVVTSGVFVALEVPPILGRTFVADDDRPGDPNLAVLSHGLWQRRFGSDTSAVGQRIMLSGTLYTIVGVMPPLFGFPSGAEEVWVTLESGYWMSTERRGGDTQVLGRMLPGISFNQAARAMDDVALRIHEANPEDTDSGIRLVPRKEMEVASARSGLLLLLGAVALVLLIACTNIANLLLVRATERGKELCLRKALGAGRVRLVAQMMTEGVALSLAGGVVGCLISIGTIQPFTAMYPGRLPRVDAVSVDYRMLAFTVALALLTGLLMSVLPALRAGGAPIAGVLQEGGRRLAGGRQRSRAQSVLVVSEIAMAFMLLVGAGLFIKSLVRLTSIDRGFTSENLLTMRLVLPDPYQASDDLTRVFFQDLADRLRGLPGVAEVAYASQIPLIMGMWFPPTLIETSEQVVETAVHSVVVSPTYFRALGIPLLSGRAFAPVDRDGSVPVVVISQAMAQQYWPDEDPIGRRLKAPNDSSWRTVVGVVGNIRQRLQSGVQPTVYMPAAQRPVYFGTIVAKTYGDPTAITALARETVWAIDRDLPVSINVLDDAISQSRGVAQPRFATIMLSVLAGAAALLAVLGVYAVLAYAVTQRTHEIGIRMALGAGTGSVMRAVLQRGVVLATLGLGIGLVATLVGARLLRSLLFGVSPTDPATLATVALVVTAATLAASYLPARRATRVDPLTALRSE